MGEFDFFIIDMSFKDYYNGKKCIIECTKTPRNPEEEGDFGRSSTNVKYVGVVSNSVAKKMDSIRKRSLHMTKTGKRDNFQKDANKAVCNSIIQMLKSGSKSFSESSFKPILILQSIEGSTAGSKIVYYELNGTLFKSPVYDTEGWSDFYTHHGFFGKAEHKKLTQKDKDKLGVARKKKLGYWIKTDGKFNVALSKKVGKRFEELPKPVALTSSFRIVW